ncbi:MAG TPA: peptidoglycan DD-metalloendopeptidase family protein [Mesorhizobium sp.]|jgi:septal ring factor EnvC (AmiA/AmiB activator)|nr:peptidoglycan DD-metalloendopeptidase family protein [Mesorhizobium sp.]
MAAALAILTAMGAAAAETDPLAEKQSRSRGEYERVREEIRLSDERAAQLAAEIATVRKDHVTLTAELVRSAAAERRLGEEIDAVIARLEPLHAQSDAIQHSLAERRDVLAEVLGALQRMGLNPPPALMVRPEDALGSVRSAILLGAVVPGLRAETDRLLADLDALELVAAAIRGEEKRLREVAEGQLAEKRRLSMLLGEKERLRSLSEVALASERKRAVELAAEAVDLKELIAGLEREAARAERERQAQAQKEQEAVALASLPVPEANRLAPASPFAALKGKLTLPVGGKVRKKFGDGDGHGGVMLGNMVATQSGAIVTSPADGSVLYAGPFRSFGQLLILDAGEGYHVVLAGLHRISVMPGQPVLAGEPLGMMGDGGGLAKPKGPELYVEFRENGRPVDPAPWWVGGKVGKQSGRTGNGA